MHTENQEKQDTSSSKSINIAQGKISIDTKQSKEILENIGQHAKDAAQNIGQNIKECAVDLFEKFGIKIENDKLEIDLKQTKSYIEELGAKIEHLLAKLENDTRYQNRKK